MKNNIHSQNSRALSLESQIRAFAGTFVLLSLLLAQLHSQNWLWFTAFVGVNLLQSSFTKFCLLELALKRVQQK